MFISRRIILKGSELKRVDRDMIEMSQLGKRLRKKGSKLRMTDPSDSLIYQKLGNK